MNCTKPQVNHWHFSRDWDANSILPFLLETFESGHESEFAHFKMILDNLRGPPLTLKCE